MTNIAKIPTLDGWRAIAFLMIFAAHAGGTSVLRHPEEASWWIWTICSGGAIGINIFFSISGYLITRQLIETGNLSRSDIRAFFVRRIFRILPPPYVYLISVAILSGLGVIPDIASEFLPSIAMYRNYKSEGWYTAHFWSLSIEEQFYFLWPFVIILILKTKRQLLVISLFAGAWTVWAYASVKLGWYTAPSVPGTMLKFTDLFVKDLATGAVAAFLTRGTPTAFKILNAVGVPLVCLIASVYMDSPELKAFQAIFITCVILGTSENPQSATSRLLSLPILQWIGRRTYSFYLWQQLFMGLPILFGMENNTLRLAYVTGGTLVCGLISYHLVEGPFIRMGKALLARTS